MDDADKDTHDDEAARKAGDDLRDRVDDVLDDTPKGRMAKQALADLENEQHTQEPDA